MSSEHNGWCLISHLYNECRVSWSPTTQYNRSKQQTWVNQKTRENLTSWLRENICWVNKCIICVTNTILGRRSFTVFSCLTSERNSGKQEQRSENTLERRKIHLPPTRWSLLNAVLSIKASHGHTWKLLRLDKGKRDSSLYRFCAPSPLVLDRKWSYPTLSVVSRAPGIGFLHLSSTPLLSLKCCSEVPGMPLTIRTVRPARCHCGRNCFLTPHTNNLGWALGQTAARSAHTGRWGRSWGLWWPPQGPTIPVSSQGAFLPLFLGLHT